MASSQIKHAQDHKSSASHFHKLRSFAWDIITEDFSLWVFCIKLSKTGSHMNRGKDVLWWIELAYIWLVSLRRAFCVEAYFWHCSNDGNQAYALGSTCSLDGCSQHQNPGAAIAFPFLVQEKVYRPKKFESHLSLNLSTSKTRLLKILEKT